MNDIGLIGVLQDNGATADALERYLRRLRRQPVNPIQFREAIARIFYSASLINRTPKYLMISKPPQILPMPLQGLSTKPVFDPWVPAQYAHWLSTFCGIPYEECYDARTDSVGTFFV